jgi:hypothetical protein
MKKGPRPSLCSVAISLMSAISGLTVAAQPPASIPSGSRTKLVDIGGQRFFLDCRGVGSPAVLLEAGAGDLSVVWSLVQDRAAVRPPYVLVGQSYGVFGSPRLRQAIPA